MGSGRQVGLKGRPLCAGVSVEVIVRSYAAKVDVYVDEPAEPICVETPPIDRAHGQQRRSNLASRCLTRRLRISNFVVLPAAFCKRVRQSSRLERFGAALSYGTGSPCENSDRSLRTARIRRRDARPLSRISLRIQLHDILLSAAAAAGVTSAIDIQRKRVAAPFRSRR
jgi:hypothetical protein